jgi:hypothetical protein
LIDLYGDTLFIVMGRDLAQKKAASWLKINWHNIIPFLKNMNQQLPDDVTVYAMVPVVLWNMSKDGFNHW